MTPSEHGQGILAVHLATERGQTMSLPLTALAQPVELSHIQELISEDMRLVDRLIQERLHSDVALVNQVAQYIVHSGGKRLRPMLVLLCTRALDYDGDDHLSLAAIIEFIHTATLLHDDVVDASLLRRGHETANAVWGNDASVLVGDFLYSRAFQMMVELDEMRIMRILADTTNVIAEGEVLQLLNRHEPDTSEQQYLQVIRSKTAKLFEAAAQLGAVLGKEPAPIERAMAAYGLHLGIAYQVIDDVLDYCGTPDQIGKNIGDDLGEGNPTLPLIYAMRNGSQAAADAVRAAIRRGGADRIEQVIDAVESTNAIAYTARAARTEADRALTAIQVLPPSPYKEALQSLAEFAVSRNY